LETTESKFQIHSTAAYPEVETGFGTVKTPNIPVDFIKFDIKLCKNKVSDLITDLTSARSSSGIKNSKTRWISLSIPSVVKETNVTTNCVATGAWIYMKRDLSAKLGPRNEISYSSKNLKNFKCQ